MTKAVDPGREAIVLAQIAATEDPARIDALIANAKRLGAHRVLEAAMRRRAELSAEGEPGTIGNDFWRAVHTLEAALGEEKGRSARLTRTRQKIARVGEAATVADLASAPKPSAGFAMLVERGMWDLTAEAVVLRHPADFDAGTVAAARARLQDAGCDTSRFPSAAEGP